MREGETTAQRIRTPTRRLATGAGRGSESSWQVRDAHRPHSGPRGHTAVECDAERQDGPPATFERTEGLADAQSTHCGADTKDS
jgi:hypothetical protein